MAVPGIALSTSCGWCAPCSETMAPWSMKSETTVTACVEQSAGVLSEVEHEAGRALTLERASSRRSSDRCADAERAQLQVTPALPRERHQPCMHCGRVDERARDMQVEDLAAAREHEVDMVPAYRGFAPSRATSSASPSRASPICTIVSPTWMPACCAGPGRRETTTNPCGDGSTLDADAVVCGRSLLTDELVRRQVRDTSCTDRRAREMISCTDPSPSTLAGTGR